MGFQIAALVLGFVAIILGYFYNRSRGDRPIGKRGWLVVAIIMAIVSMVLVIRDEASCPPILAIVFAALAAMRSRDPNLPET